MSRKCRVLDVVYNASNNELVRTKALVKNCIVQIDAAPFKTWYESHYGVKVGVKKVKGAKVEEEEVKRSKSVMKKLEERQKFMKRQRSTIISIGECKTHLQIWLRRFDNVF